MITLSCLFTFLGFWVCYRASRRVAFAAANKGPKPEESGGPRGASLGVMGLLAGFALSALRYGIGSGSFFFLIMLTIVSSLVILLAPLGFMKRRTIGMLTILSMLIEITI
ncbi:MAG: hypothetical protein RIC30_16905 [Marinoscillum sp.]|uniref:hypothetical protein n=1 Tax=Marinoscillum sp. TaxID=2024838 RepID=UPI003302ADAF